MIKKDNVKIKTLIKDFENINEDLNKKQIKTFDPPHTKADAIEKRNLLRKSSISEKLFEYAEDKKVADNVTKPIK